MRPMSWCGGVALAVAVTACAENTGPEVQLDEVTDRAAVTNLTFAQVSAGQDHTCGRTMSGGKLYCWGDNYYGQLGNATRNNKKRPTPVSSSLQFRWVSAGPGHTCAITTGGAAYCWGDNDYGQLGDGTSTDRWSPVLVAGGYSWKQIEVGGSWSGFTCGITSTDRLLCWGYNGYGQLGLGYRDYYDHVYPAYANSSVTFRQLSAGGYHACAVSTGNAAYCWGEGSNGQTGNGGVYYQPTAVSGGLAFRQVSAGANHTCGTTTGSKAYCWGYGYYGANGDGTTASRFAPKAVSGTQSYSRVFASGEHTCGITTGQKAFCWGTNAYGQLGDGTKTRRLTPVAVKTTVLWSVVSSRGSHTCGVQKDTGVGYCWGANGAGQVGDATTTQRLVPTKVAGAL